VIVSAHLRTCVLAAATALAWPGCAGWFPKAKTKQEQAMLDAAADAYWLAVRWNDPKAIGGFLETPEEKLRVARQVAAARWRFTDTTVLQAVISEPLPKERAPDLREATVIVKVDGWDTRTNAARAWDVEQHWLRRKAGWSVDTERSPIDEDVPW
jgi:hypothetical protein